MNCKSKVTIHIMLGDFFCAFLHLPSFSFVAFCRILSTKFVLILQNKPHLPIYCYIYYTNITKIFQNILTHAFSGSKIYLVKLQKRRNKTCLPLQKSSKEMKKRKHNLRHCDVKRQLRRNHFIRHISRHRLCKFSC